MKNMPPAIRICAIGLGCLGLGMAAVPVDASPMYTALQVTTAMDPFTFTGEAAINNSGEIAYIRADQSSTQVYSTRRGQLTFDATPNARFADINNVGEVVYSDFDFLDGQYALRTYSTGSGVIGVGNSPRINDLGQVGVYNSPAGELGIYQPDGTLSAIALDSEAAYVQNIVRTTDAGEVIYSARDVYGFDNLFSSTRGMLTDFQLTGSVAFAANNLGDFSYIWNNVLYWGDGTQLWSGDAWGLPAMNDLGDIVFNHQVLFDGGLDPEGNPQYLGAFDIVLLTQQPEYYQARDGFHEVPEPATLGLLSMALTGLAFMKRRRTLRAKAAS